MFEIVAIGIVLLACLVYFVILFLGEIESLNTPKSAEIMTNTIIIMVLLLVVLSGYEIFI